MNPTLVASAVAVLTVIACIVAIALTLSGGSGGDAAGALLLVPSAYTASFHIQWRDAEVAGGAPTGFTTHGMVAVGHGDMSFSVVSVRDSVAQMSTTYAQGLLYAAVADDAWFCLGPHSPSLDLAATSQRDVDASVSPAAGAQACNGTQLSVRALHADHVVCVQDKVLQWVRGDSYTLTLTAFDPHVARHLPPPAGANMTLCPPEEGERRRRRTSAAAPLLSKTSVVAAPRKLATPPLRHVCFMHGMGEPDGPGACGLGCADNLARANLADVASYWGAIQNYVPGGAAYTHAIHVNTKQRGWDYGGTLIQDLYYEYIKFYKCDVVFAHSMGNVILAALAARGKPVHWYMSQGPLRGSWGASWADAVCAQWYNPLGATAWALGYCTSLGGGGNSAVKSLTVRNYKTVGSGCELGGCPGNVGAGVAGWAGGAKELSWSACWRCSYRIWGACVAGYAAGEEVCADSGALISAPSEAAFAPYVKGRLCGSSAFGQGGLNGAGLAAIAAFVNYGEASDGMVSMSSCAQANSNKGQGLAADPANPNYALNGNHADGTCRSGDGAGGDQKACTWYRNMVLRGTGVCPIPGFCSAP